MKIELIFDHECPNVEATRINLRTALDGLGLSLNWIEIDRENGESPAYARRYGSPTVLVNGKDVYCIDSENEGNCCRVYLSCGVLSGAPPAEIISDVLEAQLKNDQTLGFSAICSSFLGSLAALLPALSCPACWPAYAGLLSSLGIGFLDYSPILTPIVVLLIVTSLFCIWRQTDRHIRAPQFLLGLLGGVLIVLSRLREINSGILYLGIILLVSASAWTTAVANSTRRSRSAKQK